MAPSSSFAVFLGLKLLSRSPSTFALSVHRGPGLQRHQTGNALSLLRATYSLPVFKHALILTSHIRSSDCSHAVHRNTAAFLKPNPIHRLLSSLSLPLVIRRVGCCPRPLSQADPPHFSTAATFTTFNMVAWQLLALAITLLAAVQPVAAASDTRYVTTTNSAGQTVYLAGQ